MAGREVKIFITADAKGVDRAVDQVEGRFGKLSGKMKGALAGVSLAAIGSGVMSAARDFQDAAVAANDFATASGLSVEQASRWQEVAGDLGVDASKLEGAIGRLSKGLGQDADKWKKYGVSVKRAADGTVDANATFLDAISVLHDIDDPLERAKVGSELFGRSWADLAPLVELSAEDLTTALEGVGDAQVIDEAEVEKAKQFREKMDQLNDSTMGLKLTLAEALLPAISGLSEWISTLDPQVVTWTIGIGGAVIAVGKLSTAVSGVSSVLSLFAAHPVFTATVLIVAAIALIAANWDSVTAAVQRAIDKVEAFGAMLSGPYKWINNFLGGDFGQGSDLGLNTDNPYVRQVLEGRAAGGPVSARSPYMVGERGPELFVPSGSGRIIPNDQMAAGRQVTINVYPQSNDPIEIAREIRRAEQRALRGAGVAA